MECERVRVCMSAYICVFVSFTPTFCVFVCASGVNNVEMRKMGNMLKEYRVKLCLRVERCLRFLNASRSLTQYVYIKWKFKIAHETAILRIG